MKSNDKKKLYLVAGALFVLVVFVRGIPWALDYYQSGRDEIARLQKRVANYRALAIDTAQWQQKEQLKNAELKDLQNWVFPGTDPGPVSSSVQRSLRQLAADNNVEVRQTGVPHYSYVDKGKWLMVEQDLDFSLSQAAILPFLRAIDAARPRLHVTAFSINHSRRNYTGSLTVVGFAKAADKSSATAPPMPPSASRAGSASSTAVNPFAKAVKP